MNRISRRVGAPGVLLAAIFVGLYSITLRAQETPHPSARLQAQVADALASYRAPARSATVDYGAAQALRTVYAQRDNALLWSRDGHLTTQARALIHELQQADSYGLERRDYAAERLRNLAESPAGTEADAGRWARFDVQLSGTALRFLSDLHYGRVKPAAAGFNLQGTREPMDLPAALTGLAAASDVVQTIGALEPPFKHYALLKSALAKYLDLAQHPELKHLPAISTSIKPGDRYAGAPALRGLLTALGDMPATSTEAADEEIFSPELSAGVRTFQQRHGMAPDGVLGKSTLAALTTPFTKRVRQIELTLERWRWLPPFQTPPIIVNIPQFRLFAFRTTEDRVADILQMDVIVGKTYPRNQTPAPGGKVSWAGESRLGTPPWARRPRFPVGVGDEGPSGLSGGQERHER